MCKGREEKPGSHGLSQLLTLRASFLLRLLLGCMCGRWSSSFLILWKIDKCRKEDKKTQTQSLPIMYGMLKVLHEAIRNLWRVRIFIFVMQMRWLGSYVVYNIRKYFFQIVIDMRMQSNWGPKDLHQVFWPFGIQWFTSFFFKAMMIYGKCLAVTPCGTLGSSVWPWTGGSVSLGPGSQAAAPVGKLIILIQCFQSVVNIMKRCLWKPEVLRGGYNANVTFVTVMERVHKRNACKLNV